MLSLAEMFDRVAIQQLLVDYSTAIDTRGAAVICAPPAVR
jgi:hypothetical protein